MRWEDERYVRVYTRDTVEWEMLPWQSRALWPLLLRKVDRAGLLELGKHGVRGLSAIVKIPEEVVAPGIAGLLEDGCVEQHGTTLVVPNFIAAQETPASPALRAKDYRDRKRAEDRDAAVTKRDDASRKVTERHEASHGVTQRTDRHSVPIRSVPFRTLSEGEVADATPPAAQQGALDLANQEPPRPRKPPAPEVAEAITHFQRRWVELRSPADGQRPTVTDADRGQLIRLLKAHGLEPLKAYVDRYLTDEDPFLAKEGYALRHLPRRIDGYRTKPATPGRRGTFAPTANFAEAGDKTSEYT